MTDILRNALAGLTASEIKEVKEYLSTIAKDAKATAKAEKASADEARVAEVNGMISANTLKVGDKVIVLYGSKNLEVEGTLVGVLSVEKATLTVESDAFESKTESDKPKRRYIAKARFVRLAD